MAAEATSALRVGLLGVLTVHVDGRVIDVPGDRRRTLLAALAMAQGRVIATERLIDLVWPEIPPQDAVRALYNQLSRLRKQLGSAGGRLSTHQAGYALNLGVDELDVTQVRNYADLLPGCSAPEALGLARRALDIWRGPALEEFRTHPDLAAAAISLDELRARLRDDLTEALLDVGDRAAVAGAQAAAADQPLRERTALLMVRALAHDGRQAEAMQAAAAFRRRLAEEAGLDAGPDLAALEQRVAAGQLAPLSVSPRRSNLARPTGPLVGRGRDREEVRRLLGQHRVVTLTGAGGVGKTRLALDVAPDVADTEGVEVLFVDLAAVEDPTRMAQSVGSTLLLSTSKDVSANGIADALGQSRVLLLLDNCEHVVEACRELVDAVVARAPGVRILATSRIVLHSRNEYVIRLQPLPIPAENAGASDLDRQPSVQAFVEHAKRRDRSFDLRPEDIEPLLETLRRLDGLPLAIEIAAGHAVTMPITTLRDRLALDLAAPGEPSGDARQGTMRATIRWSHDMLGPDEQALLAGLSLFPGGVDLDTLERLASDLAPGQDPLSLMRRLVDSSLLDVESDRSRYRLLFTVRSFLLQALRNAGVEAQAEARFLHLARATAIEIGNGLVGADEAASDRRLRAELPNLRAARDLARDQDDIDTLVDITLAVDQPSILRDMRELWAWCLELAEHPAAASHGRATEIFGAAADAARVAGAYERAVELAGRALTRPQSSPEQRVRCESALAGVALYRGDFAGAGHGWLKAAEASVNDGLCAAYLASAALARSYAGDKESARKLLERATRLAKESSCLGSHAFAMYVAGELTAPESPLAAVPAYESAIAEARAVGATFVVGVASVALATARSRTGDPAVAARAFADLLDTWHLTGQGPQLWTTARNAANLLLAEGRVREATLLAIHAEQSPDATAVDETIAARSGRTQVSINPLPDPEQLASIRREAEAMSVRDVLDAARRALLEVAGGSGNTA